jgi:hypothetical protein
MDSNVNQKVRNLDTGRNDAAGMFLIGETQGMEVIESVEVGIEMGGGPATVSARFALDGIEDVYGK